MTAASDYRLGYGTGRTSENVTVWTGTRHPVGTVPTILCHGLLGTATQWFDQLGVLSTYVGRLLASRGFISIGPDLGLGTAGSNNWGHDDVVNPGGAIDDAISWAASVYGTRTDKVAIYGTSMGGTAINWCWRNPDKVAAAVLTLPAVALERIRARDPSGLGALIDQAYAGEGGWAASASTHDPSHPDNVAKIVPFAHDVRIFYSGDDAIILPDEVEDFAAATGVEATNVGNIGHSLEFDHQPLLDWLVPRLQWA